MNRTTVKANLVPEDEVVEHPPLVIINATRTEQIIKRMARHPSFNPEQDGIEAPHGYYLNHPVLGKKSTSIDNGIYVGGVSREAIVVDGKSAIMQQTYKDTLSKLYEKAANSESNILDLHTALKTILHEVQEVIPSNEEKTNYIGYTYRGDKAIGLSTYLEKGAGVCRHQGLLAAFIIENLIKDGFMSGNVGIERNEIKGLGAHAWAIYKPTDNPKDDIVVDPTQSFIGTKDQAQREKRWEYRLN